MLQLIWIFQISCLILYPITRTIAMPHTFTSELAEARFNLYLRRIVRQNGGTIAATAETHQLVQTLLSTVGRQDTKEALKTALQYAEHKITSEPILWTFKYVERP